MSLATRAGRPAGRPGARRGRRARAGGDVLAAASVVGLGLGLVAAILLRVGIAGVAGVRSPAAGSVFALLLGGLCLAAGPQPATAPKVRGWRGPSSVEAGLAGAAVLCAVPMVVHLRTPGAPLGTSGLPVWAVVVSAVAVAEEAMLRGRWWSALQAWRGEGVALTVTTVAFALLHVPLYGWSALPLDLAVGLLLGGLRMLTGGWAAPAVAHTVADLAGWWLR